MECYKSPPLSAKDIEKLSSVQVVANVITTDLPEQILIEYRINLAARVPADNYYDYLITCDGYSYTRLVYWLGYREWDTGYYATVKNVKCRKIGY